MTHDHSAAIDRLRAISEQLRARGWAWTLLTDWEIVGGVVMTERMKIVPLTVGGTILERYDAAQAAPSEMVSRRYCPHCAAASGGECGATVAAEFLEACAPRLDAALPIRLEAS